MFWKMNFNELKLVDIFLKVDMPILTVNQDY